MTQGATPFRQRLILKRHNVPPYQLTKQNGIAVASRKGVHGEPKHWYTNRWRQRWRHHPWKKLASLTDLKLSAQRTEIPLSLTIISKDFAFVRTLVRFGPSRVLGSPLFSDHSWPSDLMGRAAITGTLPSPPAKIVDAHSRKLSEVDPDRSSSDLIF
jgi:hypothetical protein